MPRSALEIVKEQRFYFTFSQKLQTRTLQKQLFNLPEVSLTSTAFCMLISEDRTTSRLPVKPDHFLHQYRVHTLRIGGEVFPQCRFRVKVLV